MTEVENILDKLIPEEVNAEVDEGEGLGTQIINFIKELDKVMGKNTSKNILLKLFSPDKEEDNNEYYSQSQNVQQPEQQVKNKKVSGEEIYKIILNVFKTIQKNNQGELTINDLVEGMPLYKDTIVKEYNKQ